MLHRELQSVDHVEYARLARLVGDLDRDEVGIRRDADVVTVVRIPRAAIVAVAGDDPGHIRSVTVTVSRGGGISIRHGTRNDPRGTVVLRGEVGQRAGDPAYNYSSPHTRRSA